MNRHRLFYLLTIFIVINSFSFSQDKPKNIIIMIGDGMGINYVSTNVLTNPNSPFREFAFTGLVVTCSADKLITDSAAGGTAIAAGHKTKNGYLGVDSSGQLVHSIFDFAKRKNYSTGLVVTSAVTHATPAAFFAHISSRKNEDAIAEQMLDKSLDIVVGGGKKFFLPDNEGGTRKDSINLIDIIRKTKNYYDNFNSLDSMEMDGEVVALLSSEGLPPASKRDYKLSELAQIALNKLSQNKNGFVLMIEGSQIDWAGHDNIQEYALEEMNDFAEAITTCLDFVKKDKNTLLLVTADHETGGMAITKGTLDGKLELSFTTKSHTPELVGVFTQGPGAKYFTGIQDIYQIGRKLIYFIDPSISF